jgi:hypothetical protein
MDHKQKVVETQNRRAIAEKTEVKLKEHRSLPIGKRIISRALDRYPTEYERRCLKEEKKGYWGRTVDDAIKSIQLTRRLNKTPSALLGGKWRTAPVNLNYAPATFWKHYFENSSLEGEGNSSILYDLSEDPDSVGVLLALLANNEDTAGGNGDFDPELVSVIIPGDKKHLLLTDKIKRFGLYVEDKGGDSRTIIIDKEKLNSMPEELEIGVEGLLDSIYRHTSLEYSMNKPESY